MKMVNLLYDYDARGPGKVIHNLMKGFEKIGVEFQSNNFDLPPSDGYYCGLLQSIPHVHDKKLYSALCGPNLFVLPSGWGEVCKNYKHFIVPSQWVHDKYRRFSDLDGATIDIWPVGIDTEFWTNSSSLTSDKRCLIYFKSRLCVEAIAVANKLNQMGIAYDVLEYGHYNEKEMIEYCNRCNFAILITGTESQGIGYMEILSMGLPCYVLNKTIWDYDSSCIVSSTSVPYFDETCGIIVDGADLNRLDEFVQSINTYRPRDYICNNFTLAKKAKDYYELLELYNCIGDE